MRAALLVWAIIAALVFGCSGAALASNGHDLLALCALVGFIASLYQGYIVVEKAND